jgi:hypothetical protein
VTEAAGEVPRVAIPEVGDATVIPAIELAGADFFIAYRHTHHAYVDTYGYDTEVIRFWESQPEGALRSARIAQRKMDGEYDIDIIDFARSEGRITVLSKRSSLGWSECVLSSASGTLVAKGKDFTFTYSAPAGKGLRIERRYGERRYIEEWKPDGAAIITDTEGRGAKGRFEGAWPLPSRYIEGSESDPSGGSDTEYSFFDVEGGVKFRADSAEPLGECFVADLAKGRPEGISLEDIALIDIILGTDRRVTPLLARMYLGKR